jgi:Vacuolar protein sorting-associated protein
LLKNTVQGTFGTVSKLANSLATGITLTQDREYLSGRQREKMNKPKNIVDGVGMGFKVFFSNVGKGISGVVTEPIRGYKKRKLKGCLLVEPKDSLG